MHLNKPLFLIGLRASGKTALGQILSKKLFLPLYDTDLLIHKACGKNIAEIINSQGWAYFREQESSVLKNIPLEKSVVSTGGGIILNEDNRVYLKNNGICIFLDPPVEVLCSRLTRNPLKSQRPAFVKESIEEEVVRLYKERKDFYLDVAHLKIDSSKSMKEITIKIQEYLKTL